MALMQRRCAMWQGFMAFFAPSGSFRVEAGIDKIVLHPPLHPAKIKSLLCFK
jgi:hypothetical protein